MDNTINSATVTDTATATATARTEREQHEIELFERGVGEGAARVLDNRWNERDKAILSMGRRTGGAGVRAGIRSLVKADFAPLAKDTRGAVMIRALGILRGE
jgi:hypothetical protein